VDLCENTGSVLVAIMNNQEDLRHAREERWYRIPLARAPRPLASDYLALYLTAAFGEERWAVRYIAEVLRYEVMPRCRILPHEPDHPRAQRLYYRLSLGPLEPLARPVPARSLRRVTFIRTTLACLENAKDVTDLWSTRCAML